jgi:hypothetical protein
MSNAPEHQKLEKWLTDFEMILNPKFLEALEFN